MLPHGPPREPIPDEADLALDHPAVAAEAAGGGEEAPPIHLPGGSTVPTKSA